MLRDFDHLSSLVWIHVWQIALVGAAVGVVNLLVGRRWPHLAYALWLVVLVKCFVPPIGGWPHSVLGRLTAEIENVGWVELVRPIAANGAKKTPVSLVPQPTLRESGEDALVGLVPRPDLRGINGTG